MNGDLDDISGPAALEDDQELWRLLGQARQPQVSPYFSRRVLREAAALPQQPPASAVWRGLRVWWQAGLPLLRPPRAAAWSGAFAAAAICTATVLMTFPNGGDTLRLSPSPRYWQHAAGPRDPAPPQPGVADDGAAPAADNAGSVAEVENTPPDDTLTPQDAEVIADLDTLMAREETHLWTDDNVTF